MKKLVAIVFATASMLAGPSILVTPSQAESGPCFDGTAPEAWLRPGGYCSKLGLGAGSLSDPAEPCDVSPAFLLDLGPLERVHLAVVSCYDEVIVCGTGYTAPELVEGDRLIVAGVIVC